MTIKPAIEIGIIGNPNSGKTTLFNALTGAKQEVGNWPGVTVEKTFGFFEHRDQTVKIVDLPGAYSLTVASEELSLDERIACDYLFSCESTLIINVVDASNLERNLYLTLQLIDMGIPIVIALNMMDIAKKKGLHIDVDALSRYLGCPVIPLEAVKKRGMLALKESLLDQLQQPRVPMALLAYPALMEKAINQLACLLKEQSQGSPYYYRRMAIKLLEGDKLAAEQCSLALLEKVAEWQELLLERLHFEPDILIAETRYAFIGDLISHVAPLASKHSVFSSWLDKVALNRFLGLPIFFFIMYAMFVFAINIGGLFQDFFDQSSQAIFVDGVAFCLQKISAPSWLVMLLAQGLGKGINTVVTFIPVIAGMFLALAFLEQSGYMARAAFVVDRMMRFIGLPGKSFVPMMVGFGCNVPAVLATRTLENKRDRILTVMMSPFMSCGARLAIFAVFTAAFFPQGGANIIFALYMIGILIAVLTGFILRRTLLRGQASPFILELPLYHWPAWRSLRMHTWHRLQGFILKAGILILPICMLLSFLNTFNLADSQSLLVFFGQHVTTLFSPMGIHANNWPATVGLFTGLLAKEVVVGTLNSLYLSSAALSGDLAHWSLSAALGEALQSIVINVKALVQTMINPILASAPAGDVSDQLYGQMYRAFGGKKEAFAYLLFVLLYFPCVSTTAAIAREIGQGWAWFSVLWTTFIAYGVAVSFYQAVTWELHPIASLIWVLSLGLMYFSIFFVLKHCSPGKVLSQTPEVSREKKLRRTLCGKYF